MSMLDDLKSVKENPQPKTDDGVVKPVAPAALNKKEQDVVVPGAPPLSPADLKVVEAAPTTPEPKPIVDPTAIAAQLTLADTDVVDMSSLMQPINAEPAPALTEPGSPAAAQPPEVSPPEPVAAAPVTPPAVTYKVGDKEFKTIEELTAYANGLAKNGTVDFTQIFDPAKLAPPPEPEQDPADIIFEDPKKAMELLKKQAKAEWEAELEARDRAARQKADQAATWAQFYKSNSDLVGFEEVVERITVAVVTENPKVTIDEGAKIVAARARARIAEQRKLLVPTETISTRVMAPTAPANKVEAKPAPAPVERPTTFIDEMKSRNRLKRGA